VVVVVVVALRVRCIEPAGWGNSRNEGAKELVERTGQMEKVEKQNRGDRMYGGKRKR
jgi:hypothetical protein